MYKSYHHIVEKLNNTNVFIKLEKSLLNLWVFLSTCPNVFCYDKGKISKKISFETLNNCKKCAYSLKL
jgi:hypothetical protein